MDHFNRKTRLCSRTSVSGLAVALLLVAIENTMGAERITLGFADEQTSGQKIPAPWRFLGNPRAGQPDFRVEEDEAYGQVLRLHAKGNQSDGIYRPVAIDLVKTPFINFAWKVKLHPKGEIGTARDDQAVQVQLNFGRHGSKPRVFSYGFDAAAESGRWYDDSSFVAVNRVLVLNSGSDQLNQWVSHSRNVLDDYRGVYQSNPPEVQTVSIFTDSNDSRSESLGYCSEIIFSEEPLHGKTR